MPEQSSHKPDPRFIHQEHPSLDELLALMLQVGASDLHLTVSVPPTIRVHGNLRRLAMPILDTTAIKDMVFSGLSDIQVTKFEQQRELDFAYSVPELGRFRGNLFRQRGSIAAVFRMIPRQMPTLSDLLMPNTVRELTSLPRGLVLVTGPTGVGKSTTLAAMLDEINATRNVHIMTIEEPIEFVHSNKMSIVNQREVGEDTDSFAAALRFVLRQDPDVIMVGEMRDLETIATALTAAETGHLVLATLHTTSAAQSIERIIDVFPPHQQNQVRNQLSNVLEGIITQTLLLSMNMLSRVCAMEILIGTSAIRNLIRENKIHQIPGVIQSSGKYGMQTLDESLKQLVVNGKVSLEEALRKASNRVDFQRIMKLEAGTRE